jgi:glycosyltransferase involved in cell wall biosynthesis
VRILTVGNQYPPHHSGGYELVWQSAVAHLRDSGHDVRVLTTDHLSEAPDSGEPEVHRELRWYWRDHAIPDRSLLSCLAIERHNLRAFDRHLRDFEPEVLSWWSMGAMSLSLIERGRRTGLPAVAFVHDDWLDYGRRTDGWHRRFRRRPRRGRIAERLTGVPTRVDFAAAAGYTFVSQRTRARALISGVALYDTDIAHSGIELSFLSPAAPREWGWRLLYVGRLDERKGLDTAIDALVDLPDEAVLDIVGEGDPGELERLTRKAGALGVAVRARFLGPRSRAELPQLYAAADAVIFPVRWEEPWGLVPLEAMAIGRPVVATGRGGSGEYLRQSRTACCFRSATRSRWPTRCVGWPPTQACASACATKASGPPRPIPRRTSTAPSLIPSPPQSLTGLQSPPRASS